MDLSPQLLREVEFRENLRGYSRAEVDEFLERLAVAVEGLQSQLRDAIRRADLAERRSGQREDSGDELKRTLVLAQRTADAAIEDARHQAQELLLDARHQAENIVDETNRHVEGVLGTLAQQRQLLEEEVEGLNAYVTQYRKRLQRELKEGLSWLERSGRLEAGSPPELSDISELKSLRIPSPASDAVASTESSTADSVEESVQHSNAEQILRFDDTAAYDLSDLNEFNRELHDTGPHETISTRSDTQSPFDRLESDADGSGHDPFLDELRRAVTEAEPLGPRDRQERQEEPSFLDDDLYDEGFSSRFRRRR